MMCGRNHTFRGKIFRAKLRILHILNSEIQMKLKNEICVKMKIQICKFKMRRNKSMKKSINLMIGDFLRIFYDMP